MPASARQPGGSSGRCNEGSTERRKSRISTRSHCVRKVRKEERSTTVAGSGRWSIDTERPAGAADPAWFLLEGMVLDRSGNLYLADPGQRRVRQITPAGLVLTVAGPPALSLPTGLALDGAGLLFIADAEAHRVLRVGPEGCMATAAGTGAAGFSGDGGSATAARLNEPWGLAVDSRGHLFIADAGNHRIRQVTPGGIITTVAGEGRAGFSGDGGAATAAQFDRPIGLAVDSQRNLFIVDSLNGRVRKVGRDGLITTVFDGYGEDSGAAPTTARYYPASVAVDREGRLLIADPFLRGVVAVAGVTAPG
jgi:sugar lactone lactonase YvrE